MMNDKSQSGIYYRLIKKPITDEEMEALLTVFWEKIVGKNVPMERSVVPFWRDVAKGMCITAVYDLRTYYPRYGIGELYSLKEHIQRYYTYRWQSNVRVHNRAPLVRIWKEQLLTEMNRRWATDLGMLEHTPWQMLHDLHVDNGLPEEAEKIKTSNTLELF